MCAAMRGSLTTCCSRNLVTGGHPDEASLWQRILAGCLTGGIGQLVASPTDVVKVRVQADGRLKLRGEAPRYKVLSPPQSIPTLLPRARVPHIQYFVRAVPSHSSRA